MIIGNVFCDAEGCTAATGWAFDSLAETYGALVEHLTSLGWGVVATVPMSASRVKCPACVDRGASLAAEPNAGRCAEEDRRDAAALLTLLRS